MLTPDEIEDRRIYLASLSTGDGPLQPDAPHATVNNRRWFRRIDGAPVPTSARRRLHEQILEQWRAANPHVARERSAIVMAGHPVPASPRPTSISSVAVIRADGANSMLTCSSATSSKQPR